MKLYTLQLNMEMNYIEKCWRNDIGDYITKLHHKNTRHNTDEYHEELKYFGIFMMLVILDITKTNHLTIREHHRLEEWKE